MTTEKKLSRRCMLQTTAALTPLALSGCASLAGLGDGEAAPLVQASDPVARAVLYYPNSRNVPAEHPLAASHTPEQSCATCVHVRGEMGDGARECPVFPGRRVNAAGWCSVWAQGQA